MKRPPARLLHVDTDDGARLAVELHEPPGAAAAAAPTIVLAHGFPHGRWLWAGVLPRLAAAGWRAAAPDLRGFGDSTLGDATLGDATLGDAAGGDAFRVAPTLDRYADDLAAVLDALAAPRAVVGGLSMGGYVALACWRRHAARVRALVLADTRAEADAPEPRARRDALIAQARRDGATAVADTQVDGALGRTTRAAPARVADFRDRLHGAVTADGVAAALAAMRDRPDATPLLASIHVPTLVIGGADDVLTPPKTFRALAAALPDARLALLDEAGHASAWERPDAFADALLAFLAAVPPDPERGTPSGPPATRAAAGG